jgi:hypothetical protein
MNDLDAVAFGQGGVRPVGAAHDLAVQFDGQALGREGQMIKELAEGHLLRHFTLLSVDRNAQALKTPFNSAE